jgi:hypothetical protein
MLDAARAKSLWARQRMRTNRTINAASMGRAIDSGKPDAHRHEGE